MKPVRCPAYLSAISDFWLAKTGEKRPRKGETRAELRARLRKKAVSHRRSCRLCNPRKRRKKAK